MLFAPVQSMHHFFSNALYQPQSVQCTSQMRNGFVNVVPFVQAKQAHAKGHEVSAFITL